MREVTLKTAALLALALCVLTATFPLAVFATLRSDVYPESKALDVRFSPTPLLGVAHFRAYGFLPMFSDGTQDLVTANKVLTAAVLTDERTFLASDSSFAATQRPREQEWAYEYELQPNRSLISASTDVISVMLPATRLLPNGSGGSGWFSITLRVRSAEPVRIAELFAPSGRGLVALAEVVRRRLISSNKAARLSLTDSALGASFAKSLYPSAKNFGHFALTDHGLAIGFGQDTVTWPAAGRVLVVVPYSAISDHLSPLAKALITNIRRPASFSNR